jgi:hypothetical protein
MYCVRQRPAAPAIKFDLRRKRIFYQCHQNNENHSTIYGLQLR